MRRNLGFTSFPVPLYMHKKVYSERYFPPESTSFYEWSIKKDAPARKYTYRYTKQVHLPSSLFFSCLIKSLWQNLLTSPFWLRFFSFFSFFQRKCIKVDSGQGCLRKDTLLDLLDEMIQPNTYAQLHCSLYSKLFRLMWWHIPSLTERYLIFLSIFSSSPCPRDANTHLM